MPSSSLALAGHKHVGPAPSPTLPPKLADHHDRQPLHGKKLGIFWDWFNDASPEVVDTCKAAVDNLCSQGAEVSSCCTHWQSAVHIEIVQYA